VHRSRSYCTGGLPYPKQERKKESKIWFTWNLWWSGRLWYPHMLQMSKGGLILNISERFFGFPIFFPCFNARTPRIWHWRGKTRMIPLCVRKFVLEEPICWPAWGWAALSRSDRQGITLVSQVLWALSVKLSVSNFLGWLGGEVKKIRSPQNSRNHVQGKLLCFIKPTLGNRYGTGVSSRVGQGARIYDTDRQRATPHPCPPLTLQSTT